MKFRYGTYYFTPLLANFSHYIGLDPAAVTMLYFLCQVQITVMLERSQQAKVLITELEQRCGERKIVRTLSCAS